jgi:hypothetical protein
MALLSFVDSAPRAYRLKAGNADLPISTMGGTSPDLVVLDLAPENCGKARPRHDSDVTGVKNDLSNAIPVIVAEDAKTLANEMKEQLKAVSVTKQ